MLSHGIGVEGSGNNEEIHNGNFLKEMTVLSIVLEALVEQEDMMKNLVRDSLYDVVSGKLCIKTGSKECSLIMLKRKETKEFQKFNAWVVD